MTRPVNPFYLLFELINIIDMHKVSCNNSIPVVNLFHNNKTKPFGCLILKFSRDFVNMMIEILQTFYQNIIYFFPEPGLFINLNHLILNCVENMIYDIRINIAFIKKDGIPG